MSEAQKSGFNRFNDTEGIIVVAKKKRSSSGIFTGTAGVYYVMSELSLHNYHAAATHGNAPDFDILVCSPTGDKSVAIQVKSTRWATRETKSGKIFDFPLSYKAAKMNRGTFFVAFVDFGVPAHQKPNIYLVPSPELHKECEGWIDSYQGKMVRFKPKFEWMEPFKVEDKNNWNQLTACGIVASMPDANGNENIPAQLAESE